MKSYYIRKELVKRFLKTIFKIIVQKGFVSIRQPCSFMFACIGAVKAVA